MYTDALPEGEGAPAAPLTVQQLHALFHAADYLDVPRLRAFCAAELHRRLRPSHAVATLQVAHALSCAPLVDAALRFIAANAPAVMRAPGWALVTQNAGLMEAIMSTMATGEPPAAGIAATQQPQAARASPAASEADQQPEAE